MLTAEALLNAETDVQTLASVINGGPTDPDVLNRSGVAIKTLAKVMLFASASVDAVIAARGYEPPVAYANGLNITRATQTVTQGGQTYAPLASALPFVTGAVFDATKWIVILPQTIVNRAGLKGLALPANGTVLYMQDQRASGTFKFNSANVKTFCDADTLEGIWIKPTGGDGTTGAWERFFTGPADADWWGYVADDEGSAGTDNKLQLRGAAATLKAMRHVANGYGAGHAMPLYIHGPGYCSDTLTFDFGMKFVGNSSKMGGGSRLRFPLGKTGLIFDVGATGWAVDGVSLRGAWDPSKSEAEAHGIVWHAQGTRTNMQIDGFEGDGLVDINDSSTNPSYNTNGDLTLNVWVQQCRRAYYPQGDNVNGKSIVGLTCILNRWIGVHETGFLGNFYTALLTESNGAFPNWNTGAANRPASYVRYSGRVFAVVVGQEVWASTNSPPASATNNQGWIYRLDAATSQLANGIPDWFSGMTLRAGGGVIHQGASNRSTFNMYSEDNQTNQFDINVGELSGFLSPPNQWIVYSGSHLVSGWAPLSLGATTIGTHNWLTRPNGSLSYKTLTRFYGYQYGNVTADLWAGGTDVICQHFNPAYYNFEYYFSYQGTTTQTQDALVTVGTGLYIIDAKAGIYLRRNGVNKMVLDSAQFYPGDDNAFNLGMGSNRFGTIYAGTGTINTSDRRLKTEIGSVDDRALDAWGEIDWQSYQYKDAVENKGKRKARVHVGLIAQIVERVFKKRGLDAFRLGLLCYDEWEDQFEPDLVEQSYVDEIVDADDPTVIHKVEKTRMVVVLDSKGEPKQRLIRKAGNLYGVRYDEALAMEAAYQRRRADRIEARLAKLEKALERHLN